MEYFQLMARKWNNIELVDVPEGNIFQLMAR